MATSTLTTGFPDNTMARKGLSFGVYRPAETLRSSDTLHPSVMRASALWAATAGAKASEAVTSHPSISRSAPPHNKTSGFQSWSR